MESTSVVSESLGGIGDDFLSPEEQLLIYRCLKTACHEICHVLSMTHCPYFECLMNGSNLVGEADKKPFALCPICLRKLDRYCEIGCDGGLQSRYFALVRTINQSNNKNFAMELALYTDLQDLFESDIEDP